MTFDDGTSAYLAHHGVLGMKWGVWNEETRRRRQGGASVKTDAAADDHKGDTAKKLAIGAAAVGVALGVAGGLYVYKRLRPDYYGYNEYKETPLKDFTSKMSTKPTTLKKGATVQRIYGDRFEDLSKKGEIYVSHRIRDNAKYADRMPNESWLRYKDVYLHKLKAKAAIKVPSEKETAEIFMKVAGDDVTQWTYQMFMRNGVRTGHGQESEYRTPFIKELKKRGYNAILDLNDYGWTKSPLLVFDPSEVFGKTKSHKLNPIDKVIAVYAK